MSSLYSQVSGLRHLPYRVLDTGVGTGQGPGRGVPGFGGIRLGAVQGECRIRVQGLPIVSIVVLFFGLTSSILRILRGNPKKELQWRL